MKQSAPLRGTRVLVTGGLGFVGSNVVRACLDHGARVTVCDTAMPGSGANPANLADVRDVVLTSDDIRSKAAVALVRSSDAVVNCAAFTSHTRSMAKPVSAFEANCVGVLNLLEGARSADHPVRFIQIGTSTQIGPMRASPVTEAHPEQPMDLYSASKSIAEQLVLLYGRQFELPVTCLRFANLYGPRAAIRDPGLGFVNYFVGLALQGKDLTVFGSGEQLRSVTYVDDAVRAIILALTAAPAPTGVFFAVDDHAHSVRQIAEAIVRTAGRGQVRSAPWPDERRTIEVGDAVISHDRITEELGWRPSTDLQSGLTKTFEYYEPRLHEYLF